MNLGTVGTSWITSSFLEAVKLSGKLNVTGVFSRSLEKGKEIAAPFHSARVFTNLDEMAQSPEIDVVYIASPNSLHFEQALTFLKNKKHVICEKPIFSNSAQLEAAFKTAEENGVFVFEAIRNLHAPNLQILKDNLNRAGKISGGLFQYISYSSRYDLFLKGEDPNIFTAEFSGGALVDLGVYPIYVVVALFGEPKDVSYHPMMLRTGVDGSGTLLLHYEDFSITILCSKISDSTLPCEIHGEKGIFILEDAAPITSIQFHDNHSKTKESLGVEQSEQDMVYEVEEFVKIIESGNTSEYLRLKELSQVVLNITEKARKQNGIVFGCEK
ncbi:MULTISPECIES: Gfo/Idh/MocA family protein [unclassified Bacillus (in: firmicutes)]|uniref:Gfo/Idh/MocA family protein n=1 Tax=unclassified Bacillus (in: firmicutes) TaxID=185979 RepID=UPI0008F17308|nr:MULTISPECIES: Gfo/Idh/MocA family oxidoreductase [unclassified Bacillus (in: firmicutes)]SFB08144.1 Predicted dehydrogenase [Bacillus sp. UNCCL13]SFQ87144.1 Predicted dehydrogenase [Bacillus sp. cl95]